MLKFYNLSRQSQTHSREITNTFVTRRKASLPRRTLYGERGEVKNSRVVDRSPSTLSLSLPLSCDEIHSLEQSLPAQILSSPLALVVVVFVVVTAFVLLYAFTALRGGIRVKLVQAPLWPRAGEEEDIFCCCWYRSAISINKRSKCAP